VIGTEPSLREDFDARFKMQAVIVSTEIHE